MGKSRSDPTAEAAMKNICREDARFRKPLKVARMAVDLCMDDLKRR